MELGNVLTQFESVTARPEGRLTLQELRGARAAPSMLDEVRIGLSANPKWLPPKYFYDEVGSHLFERICHTPEYYPSRTEDALLTTWAREIVRDTGPQTLIELGSGSSRKTAHFFAACESLDTLVRYVPVDVCSEMLLHAGQALLGRYDWLKIDAVVGDYTLGLTHLAAIPGPRLFLFLGGTIGNLDADAAQTFLRELHGVMRAGDHLVLGADRVKDVALLNAAYNDAEGLTAAFNLNVLTVLNRELGADFDPANFYHYAFFNREQSQIEMHLCARRAHAVTIPGLERSLQFAAGECVRTEISRKFRYGSLNAMLHDAGFLVRRHYQPEDAAYSLVVATPIPAR